MPIKRRTSEGQIEAHEPTEHHRNLVRSLAGIGVPHADIAILVGVTRPTLSKYYREDMEKGMAEANAKVAKTLFERAVSGDLGAAIFWAKARMGWREKHEISVNHEHSFVIRAPLPSETEEQWLTDFTPKTISHN
jgi:hypothetical protein